MTTKEAKAVPIENFLQNVGIEPKRQYGKFLYYHAPYRAPEKMQRNLSKVSTETQKIIQK